MSDLIDRQAAIDAMGKAKWAKERLMELPSVQPEILACGEGELNVSDTNVGDMISRQAAIDALHMHLMYRMGTDSNKKRLDEWINNLPSAQPERKKGKWLADNRPGGGFWVCSCCKFPSEAFAANVLYNFCPNCGAKMEEKQYE